MAKPKAYIGQPSKKKKSNMWWAKLASCVLSIGMVVSPAVLVIFSWRPGSNFFRLVVINHLPPWNANNNADTIFALSKRQRDIC